MTLILIDCENFSYNCLDEIFKDYEVGPNVQAHGFCDFSLDSQWTKQLFVKYNIIPHQVFHTNAYKNAADMALARFAMEQIYANEYKQLVIASSDSDFCDLMLFAKGRGIHVVCYASNHTNPSIELACNELRICKINKAAKEKSPSTQPISKLLQNSEAIKEHFKNDFKNGASIKEFIKAMKDIGLIAKSKNISTTSKELLEIGFFIKDECLFNSKDAAKDFKKPTEPKQATKTVKSEPQANQANTKQTNKTPKIEPAASTAANIKAPSSELLEIYETELLEHKCSASAFVEILKTKSINMDLNYYKWLRDNGFALVEIDNFVKVYPANKILNNSLEPAFIKWLKSKVDEQKAKLMQRCDERLEAYIKETAAQIAQDNEQPSSLFSNIKKLFGLAAPSDYEHKVRFSLESFWELADHGICDIKPLASKLESNEICSVKESIDWLNKCGLKVSKRDSRVIVNGVKVPKPFDEKQFDEQISKRILEPTSFDKASLEPPKNKLTIVSKASASKAALPKAQASDEQSANLQATKPNAQANKAQIEPKLNIQNAKSYSPTRRQQLANFSSSAKALFWLILSKQSNNASQFIKFLKSLNISILSELQIGDLETLGFSVNEKSCINVSPEQIASSYYFDKAQDASNVLFELVNAYGAELSKHKGNFASYSNMLKEKGLLPEQFNRQTSIEYLKLFDFVLDDECLKICPISSCINELNQDVSRTNVVLQNYLEVVQNNSDVEQLQKAAFSACLVGNAKDVKADYLLANCALKCYEPKKLDDSLYAARSLLELIKLLPQTNRNKEQIKAQLGSSAFEELEALQMIKTYQFLGYEAVFLSCDYIGENIVEKEQLKQFISEYFNNNFQFAEGLRSAICELFDEKSFEHSGYLGALSKLIASSNLAIKDLSNREKRFVLEILGFEISGDKPVLIAKPGQTPCILAPSKEHLEAAAAGALAAVKGLFASDEAQSEVSETKETSEVSEVSEVSETAAANEASKLAEIKETFKEQAVKIEPESSINETLAKVLELKNQAQNASKEELIELLRANKIKPKDLGSPNWTIAFKKHQIFND